MRESVAKLLPVKPAGHYQPALPKKLTSSRIRSTTLTSFCAVILCRKVQRFLTTGEVASMPFTLVSLRSPPHVMSVSRRTRSARARAARPEPG